LNLDAKKAKNILTNTLFCVNILAQSKNAVMRNSMQNSFAFREVPVGARHWGAFAELTAERLP